MEKENIEATKERRNMFEGGGSPMNEGITPITLENVIKKIKEKNGKCNIIMFR